jgi:hypothetical protein
MLIIVDGPKNETMGLSTPAPARRFIKLMLRPLLDDFNRNSKALLRNVAEDILLWKTNEGGNKISLISASAAVAQSHMQCQPQFTNSCLSFLSLRFHATLFFTLHIAHLEQSLRASASHCAVLCLPIVACKSTIFESTR